MKFIKKIISKIVNIGLGLAELVYLLYIDTAFFILTLYFQAVDCYLDFKKTKQKSKK